MWEIERKKEREGASASEWERYKHIRINICLPVQKQMSTCENEKKEQCVKDMRKKLTRQSF